MISTDKEAMLPKDVPGLLVEFHGESLSKAHFEPNIGLRVEVHVEPHVELQPLS